MALLLIGCAEIGRPAPQPSPTPRCAVVRVRGATYYKPAHGPPIELRARGGELRVFLPPNSYTGAETEWETSARTLAAAPDEVECVTPAD